MTAVKARILIAGTAAGPVLKLDQPISFWGGVDPQSGRISDPRHPQYGMAVAGTILVLGAAIGSSSSAAVMLELIATGKAPAALILGGADAILALGVVVGRELGHPTLPVLEAPEAVARLITGQRAEISEDGTILCGPSG
jgi:predicted aconitase with swiveling domain